MTFDEAKERAIARKTEQMPFVIWVGDGASGPSCFLC